MEVFAVYKMGSEDALGIFSTTDKAETFIEKDNKDSNAYNRSIDEECELYTRKDYSVVPYTLDVA